MLQDRVILEKRLEKLCENIVFDKELVNKITDEISDSYDMPSGLSVDFISGRNRFETTNKVTLFHFCKAIDYCVSPCPNLVKEFFSDVEKHEFINYRYEDPNKFEFPIRIKAFKMEDDCWIGNSSAKFFLSLLKASLIRYNANTQRVMKKIVKGDEESFKIFVNKKAVNQIAKSMKEKTFIPNVITLNFPEDYEAYYEYDEKTMELIIYELDFFDITDGYHRLLAICQCTNEDEDFDYPMCVRVTNYSEQKARQFIAQEDKKTHMKAVDSRSMDGNLDSNYVVERLNSDLDSSLKGIISRNKGIVNYSTLSEIIDYCFFKKKKSAKKVEVYKEVKSCFNYAIDCNPDIIESRMSVSKLCGIVIIASEYGQPDILQKKLNNFVNSDYNIDFKRACTKKTYTQILQYIEEV